MSNSCNPMECSPPGTSVCGVSQARILEWLPFPSPGDLPDPGIKSLSPALQVDFLLTEPRGEPCRRKSMGKQCQRWSLLILGWPKKSSFAVFSTSLWKKPEWTFWPIQYNIKNKALLYSVLLKNLRFNFLSNQTICLNMATFSNRLIADKMLYLWKD